VTFNWHVVRYFPPAGLSAFGGADWLPYFPNGATAMERYCLFDGRSRFCRVRAPYLGHFLMLSDGFARILKCSLENLSRNAGFFGRGSQSPAFFH
jgi:hypothetical protein